MKKREIFCFVLITIFLSFFAIAQTGESQGNEEEKIDSAYICLNNEIKNSKDLILEDSIFGVLAVGQNDILLDKIAEEKKGDEWCWPKANCKIKETAQVLLAYDRTGKNTQGIKDWLISKSTNISEIVWYLEIDSFGASSECNIKYDDLDHKINLGEDGKINGNFGSCFRLAKEGYWLEVESLCTSKTFEISCNNSNFLSALVYQKRGKNTVFVISKDQSNSLGESLTEKIDARCLSTDTYCDYEGTLWAAIALARINEDKDKYLPYLLALSEDNQKYFPESFLYILEQEEEYSAIIEKQKGGKYWEIVGTPYNRFYDTSVALLAIGGSGFNEETAAKNYLLSVQTKEGCWNNNRIGDTAFILYSAWQRGITNLNETKKEEGCTESNYFCEFANECSSNRGTIFNGLACPGIKKCCSIEVKELSCFEKQGSICSMEQECTGKNEISSEGSCCVGGMCKDKIEENLCNNYGGICREGCFSDEEGVREVNCVNSGEICCVVSDDTDLTSDSADEKSNIWIYILIFGILTILIIIAIVYRKKMTQKTQGEKDRGQAENVVRGPRGPGEYPRIIPQARFTPLQRGRISSPIRKTIVNGSRTDKEMEELMRNLKNRGN